MEPGFLGAVSRKVPRKGRKLGPSGQDRRAWEWAPSLFSLLILLPHPFLPPLLQPAEALSSLAAPAMGTNSRISTACVRRCPNLGAAQVSPAPCMALPFFFASDPVTLACSPLPQRPHLTLPRHRVPCGTGVQPAYRFPDLFVIPPPLPSLVLCASLSLLGVGTPRSHIVPACIYFFGGWGGLVMVSSAWGLSPEASQNFICVGIPECSAALCWLPMDASAPVYMGLIFQIFFSPPFPLVPTPPCFSAPPPPRPQVSCHS